MEEHSAPADMSELFQFRSWMPASSVEVYRFHVEAGVLELLTPPWEKARVLLAAQDDV